MSKLQKGKFVFTGGWGAYFGYSFLWLVFAAATMGLTLPLWIWWTIKWSVENTELIIEDA